jgi:hypothetical protein
LESEIWNPEFPTTCFPGAMCGNGSGDNIF